MSAERIKIPLNRETFFENLVIGFDHDGVMSNSRQAAVDEYNHVYGANRTVDEITGYYDIAKWAREDLGISKEEAWKIHEELWYRRPDVLFRAKPLPGAVEITKELSSRGKFYPIITSRGFSYTESTTDWYKYYMPWVNKNQIIIRNKKEVLDKDIFKPWMIKILGVNAFFEDAMHHAENIIKYTDAMVILLNNNPIYHISNRDRLVRITSLVNRLPTLQEAQKQLFCS
jgi:5'(3')-deoxyribonucleotidase